MEQAHLASDRGRAEIVKLEADIRRLGVSAASYSFGRLLSFGLIAAGVVAGASSPVYAWVICPAALLAFMVLVVLHGKVLDERDGLLARTLLLREAEERLRSRKRSRPPPQIPSGATPLERGLRVFQAEPESHEVDDATADDINLFQAPLSGGSPEGDPVRTLFGFLDWTSSILGSRRLRHMLLHPLRNTADIRSRQESVKEAAGNTKAREDLLVHLLPLRRHDLAPLARTLRDPLAFAGRKGLLIWSSILGTAAPLLIIAMAAAGDLRLLTALLPILAANLAAVALSSTKTNEARGSILRTAPFLKAVCTLREPFAAASFTSGEWRKIESVLEAARPGAARLRRHAALLGFHSYGPLFELLNWITLWELRILPIACTLLARSREPLESAAGAIGETEALLSLAIPLAERQGFELPEPADGAKPLFTARELGHPLLEHATTVRNPVGLREGSNVILVTGSNMSGKSTYLKSIALNAILAGAGGPACAAGLRWTPMAIHTDINIRDSLDDGKSYFQVEVERVLKVIEAVRHAPFVLAVFDELFRGTNSAERVALARAIIRHIRSSGALLAVATHDQTLTRIVTDDHEPGIENRHFQETVEDGRLRFDYKLREGPATTRNAIRVLETQGYPEAITREAREGMGEAGAHPRA